MATLFVDKVDPQSGTSLEIGSSGDTITIPSGATITNNGTQTGFGGVNTPAFKAKLSDTQTLSNATTTKIDFDTEMFDTNGAYDPTTNQRFTVPSGQAGKYFIYAQVYFDDVASTDAMRRIFIYKNGSEFVASNTRTVGSTGRGSTVTLSDLIDLSVGEYIEIFGYTNAGSTNLGSGGARFHGYKIIE